MAIQAKIQKAAMRVAATWPIYPGNGRPAVVKGKTIEDAILTRLGFGRDSGRSPIISEGLRATLKKAGEGAVKHMWAQGGAT